LNAISIPAPPVFGLINSWKFGSQVKPSAETLSSDPIDKDKLFFIIHQTTKRSPIKEIQKSKAKQG